MPKITIRHRWSDAALFEHEVTDEQQACGIAMRVTLEAATKACANLACANLAGANLAGADLAGANLAGSLKLVGLRPCLHIGPIGSRAATLTLWLTDQGPRVQTGCFFGTRAAFEAAVADEHGDGCHGREYGAALALLDAHIEHWAPPATQTAVGAA